MSTRQSSCSTLLFTALLILSTPLTPLAYAQNHSTEPHAAILSPADKAEVTSPVTIKFGLEHMAISPAGVEHTNGGHHHLLVDTALPTDLTQPIPNDANHLHFGKGQTETTLELPPGKHTLQLLVGDHLHRPHSKPVISEQITITVK